MRFDIAALRQSIRFRTLFWLTVVLTVVLAVFGALFVYFYTESIRLELRSRLRDRAFDIQRQLLRGVTADTLMHAPRPHNLIVEILPDSTSSAPLYSWPPRPKGSAEFFTVIDKEEQIDAVYRQTITEPFDGEIRLALVGLDNRAENVVDTLLVLDPLLLMILILLGDRLMGTILSPLKRLTGTAQTLSLSAMPPAHPPARTRQRDAGTHCRIQRHDRPPQRRSRSAGAFQPRCLS